MTSCDRCIQLLLDCAAAGNQVIEIKQHPNPPSALLAPAMALQAQARRLLIQYRRDHACDGHCPNNCRAPKIPQPRMPGSVTVTEGWRQETRHRRWPFSKRLSA